MTENEIIKMLEVEKAYMDSHAGTSQSEALVYAIEAVKEIQQYRAIGKVEEVEYLVDSYNGMIRDFGDDMRALEQYRAIGTVEQLEWCKDASHWKELFKEKLEKYEAIGTIEEFKALKEKNTPMELAEHNFQDEVHHYLCPSCRNIVSCNQNYCEECGQALET